MATCDYCGKEIVTPFKCNYCNGLFCGEHRLPPNHDCSGLDSWESLSSSSTRSHKKSRSMIDKKRKERLLENLGDEDSSDNWEQLGKYLGYAFVITLIFSLAIGIYYTPSLIKNFESKAAPMVDFLFVQENDLGKSVFQGINKVRNKHGLSSLEWNKELSVVAEKHSEDMIKKDYFSHVSPEGHSLEDRLKIEQVQYSKAGETLLKQSRFEGFILIIPIPKNESGMVKETIDGWMSSPGHREIILTPDFQEVGVGICKEDFTFYITADFIK